MKLNAKQITLCGVITALYVALTYISLAFGLAFGPIQLRFSEALTVLPVFTPYAIPALTIGCFISNLSSFNPIDLIVGTLATFISAVLTRALRKFKFFNIPILSILPPIIINALLIGLEISIFYLDKFTFIGLFVSIAEVAVGQTLVLGFLGIPLILGLNSKASRIL